MKEIVEELLKEGKKLKFVVRGNSMYPFIKDGEVVNVEKAEKIKTGDVIIFKREKELFVHRVILKVGNMCITKGDNSPFIDFPVRKEKIIAKVKKEEGALKILRTAFSLLFLPLSLPKILKGFRKK